MAKLQLNRTHRNEMSARGAGPGKDATARQLRPTSQPAT